jgi:UDP-glucuronate 4-epimerase
MYLVTGGAGFIGSHVVDALLNRGEEVVCLDNFNSYYDPTLKEQNIAHNSANPNYHLHREDIREMDKLQYGLAQYPIKKIIHLAAVAGVRQSIDFPYATESTNFRGTLNILELAKSFNVDNFVFASSSSVYGNNSKVPFSETDNVDAPISPYAASKKAGELLCHTYHHLYGFPVSCMRFFTVYGPRGRPDMAPMKFTQLINAGMPIEQFGDGTSKRDYTYIDDIVSGVIAAADTPHDYEIFNLGNNSTVELDHLIACIENSLGKKANIIQKPMQAGDVDITYADISKAKSMLGYAPATNIEEGIEKMVKWYRKQSP